MFKAIKRQLLSSKISIEKIPENLAVFSANLSVNPVSLDILSMAGISKALE